MNQTSITHPLRIDSVPVPGYQGLIGMTFCPGKRQAHALSGSWNRDLSTDLAAIASWGATILVSLIEPLEYEKVGVQEMTEKLPPTIRHIKLPIKDYSVPDAAWEESWKIYGQLIRSALMRGERVCIHCMGGLGRTGMIAAMLLVEFGSKPDDAIKTIRSARPSTIETAEQENFIRSRKPV